MRICVFGAGAVGGHIAVRLAGAGHDVSVIARGGTLAAIRANGLVLRAEGEEFHARVAASDRPSDLGAQDFVISTLKANALGALAVGVAPLLGPGTGIVFAQNGLPWWYDIGLARSRPAPPDLSRLDPGGALRKAIEPTRVIGAVIHSSNEVVAPGVIVNDSPLRNMIAAGEANDGDSTRIRELRAALAGSKIESSPVADIRQAIWRKLVINMTASILCLLTGHKATVLRDDEQIGDLFMRAIGEAMAVAQAHGIDVSDFDPQDFRSNPPDHLPSIRQDYERGRPLELESLLLTPVAFARAAGLDTPCLDAIAALAVRMERDQRLKAKT
jgi:2-dehydropantoate 2-reductase